MNFHLQEVLVHNLDICYGALGIAWCQRRLFFFFWKKEKHLWLWKDLGGTLKKWLRLFNYWLCVLVRSEKGSCALLLGHERSMCFQSQRRHREN